MIEDLETIAQAAREHFLEIGEEAAAAVLAGDVDMIHSVSRDLLSHYFICECGLDPKVQAAAARIHHLVSMWDDDRFLRWLQWEKEYLASKAQ